MGSNYSGIDFGFLYVKDMTEKDAVSTIVTSDDNLPRMNIWMLQDTEKADLLKMVLNEKNLEYTAAVIVLDFDQPWEMVNSLNKWLSLLNETVLGIIRKLPLQEQDELKKRMAMYILNYERESGEKANGDQQDKKEDKKNGKKGRGRNGDEDGMENSESDESDDEMMFLKS